MSMRQSFSKIFSIILIAGFAMIFSYQGRATAAPFPYPSTLKVLAESKDWLNVSRPLVAEELHGRIILLDFWTFCCINCIHVIPDLHYLEHKFGSQLTVIGVHSAKFQNEKDSDNIRKAILRYGIEHPVINDADFRVWKNFSVRAWPTLILLNPKGKIEQVYSGEGNRDAIERDIEKLIAEYGGQINEDPLPIAPEELSDIKTVLNFPGKMIYEAGIDKFFLSNSTDDEVLVLRPEWKDSRIQSAQIEQSFKGFNKPQGLLYRDDVLYVADTGNHQLKSINLKTRQIEILAGTGERGGYQIPKNADARRTALASPWDLEFYPDKDTIAIANAGSHQLWAYHIKDGSLSILAGNGRESIDDGVYPYNSLSQPSGLSALGDKLYFVDSETSSLRVLQNGKIETLIGTGLFDFGFEDGAQGDALLQHALGLQATEQGVYIADSYNHAVRFYDFKTKKISTLLGNGKSGYGLGDGEFRRAQLNEPNDILQVKDQWVVVDTNNNRLVGLDLKARQSYVIEAMLQPGPSTFSKRSELPNLTVGATRLVQPNGDLVLHLRSGWKINDEAPSFATVFDKSKQSVMAFSTEHLKKTRLPLSALKEGEEYILQATLYYCEDKEGSICLIKSFEQPIKILPRGEKSLMLDLM